MKTRFLTLLFAFMVIATASSYSRSYDTQRSFSFYSEFGDFLGEYLMLYELYDGLDGDDFETSSLFKSSTRFRNMGGFVNISAGSGTRRVSVESYQWGGRRYMFSPYTLNSLSFTGAVITFQDRIAEAGTFFNTPIRYGNVRLNFQYIFNRLNQQIDIYAEDPPNTQDDVVDREYILGAKATFNFQQPFGVKQANISEIGLHFTDMVRITNDIADIFRGNVDSVPTTAFIRVRSIVPEDTAVGFVYEQGLATSGTFQHVSGGTRLFDTARNAYYYEFSGNEEVIFVLSGISTNEQSLRVQLRLGGTYIVQARYNQNFSSFDEYNALPDDTKLYSARAGDPIQQRSFSIGQKTANLVFSTTIEASLFQSSITGEIALNTQFLKYSPDGRYFSALYPALYIDAERSIEELSFLFNRFIVNANVHYVDPRYSVSFAGEELVVDNDDNDDASPSGANESFESVDVDQINPNGIADFYEEFLLFSADPIFFADGFDQNNNYIAERDEDGNVVEDDSLPDFPYRRNRIGYSVDIDAAISPFIFGFGHLYEQTISSPFQSFNIYALAGFEGEILSGDNFEARLKVKYVRDNLKDEYVSVPKTVYEGDDPLEFTNSLVNTSIFEYRNELVEGLAVRAKYKNIFNLRIAQDFNVVNDGFLFQAERAFTLSPASKVTALMKYTIERRYEIEGSDTRTDFDLHVDSFGVRYDQIILDTSTISFGGSVLHFRDLLPQSEFESFRIYSLITEFVLGGRSRNRSLLFTTAFKYNRREALDPTENIDPEDNFFYYFRFITTR